MTRTEEYVEQRRKFNSLVSRLERGDLEKLTEELLMKRHVDGGKDRCWDALAHWDCEQEVARILAANDLGDRSERALEVNDE